MSNDVQTPRARSASAGSTVRRPAGMQSAVRHLSGLRLGGRASGSASTQVRSVVYTMIRLPAWSARMRSSPAMPVSSPATPMSETLTEPVSSPSCLSVRSALRTCTTGMPSVATTMRALIQPPSTRRPLLPPIPRRCTSPPSRRCHVVGHGWSQPPFLVSSTEIEVGSGTGASCMTRVEVMPGPTRSNERSSVGNGGPPGATIDSPGQSWPAWGFAADRRRRFARMLAYAEAPRSATELFPIITTPDLARALAFYGDLLGGQVTFEFPGPDGEAAYGGVDVGSSQIGIGRDPSVDGVGPGRSVVGRAGREGPGSRRQRGDCRSEAARLDTRPVAIRARTLRLPHTRAVRVYGLAAHRAAAGVVRGPGISCSSRPMTGSSPSS